MAKNIFNPDISELTSSDGTRYLYLAKNIGPGGDGRIAEDNFLKRLVATFPNIGLPSVTTVDGTEELVFTVPGGGKTVDLDTALKRAGVIAVPTVAALLDIPHERAVGNVALVGGYYADGDGGGGPPHRYAHGYPAGTFVHNGGSVKVPTGGDGSAAWLGIDGWQYSALDFGCVGDGVVNDVAKLQIAVNTVSRLEINAGKTFKVSSALQVGGCSLFGGGHIRGTHAGAVISMTTIDSDNIEISGIEISSSSSSGSAKGIDAIGAILATDPGPSNYNINNCRIHDFSGGIGFTTGRNASLGGTRYPGYKFSNNLVTDCAVGIFLYTQSEYGLISNNIVKDNVVGIRVQSGNCTLFGNNVDYNESGVEYIAGTNDSHGLFVGNNVNHNTVSGLTVTSLNVGYQKFIGNHFFNTTASSGSVIVNSNTTGQILFSGCTVDGAVSGTGNTCEVLWSDMTHVSGSDTLAKNINTTEPKAVPTLSSSAGKAGQIAMDSNFLYVCYANSTWKKIALSAF